MNLLHAALTFAAVLAVCIALDFAGRIKARNEARKLIKSLSRRKA